MTEWPARVEIREVGPRDGLQNEAPVPVADRIRLIDALSRTGLRRIEAAAFVSAKAIPPMAGSDEVMAQIDRVDGVTYSALVPNAKGAELAIAARADELELAHAAGIEAEAIVSTSFGCPYEGDIEPPRVAQLAGHLVDAGADRLSFGDTTGMATPRRVHDLVDALERAGILAGRVGLHFHDTRGTALANVLTALERGVMRFDASVGGLGGCPYAPGASGNAVTEDLVHMCADMNIETGIDLDALLGCAELARDIVGRELPSA